jgi:hypothetical protein
MGIPTNADTTWRTAAYWTGYALAAAFATYFCMYAFRKPFAAAQFEGEHFAVFGQAVELKTAFVISQILGYTLSKFLGIKVCSEVTRRQRPWLLAGLIAAAAVALLLFAVLPRDWKVLAIFLNGLPLGMVWGLVVAYLEGRRTSELLLAGLSCSFIVADGAVKDVGRALLGVGVREEWMPFVTGLLFLPPFLVCAWLLDRIPAPSTADEIARVRREPMDRNRRLAFLRTFLLGLVLLITAYFFITAYRDFRSNFSVELIDALHGEARDRTLFTRIELLVAFGVLGVLALLTLVRNNRRGLLGAFGVILTGLVLLGVGTALLDAGVLDGFWWMVCVGLGAYLAFVPFGSVLFDRLIASTRVAATAVFTIYVAEAIGYTGSIAVQLVKDRLLPDMSRLEFFRGFSYALSLVGSALLVGSCVYFLTRHRHHDGPADCPGGGAMYIPSKADGFEEFVHVKRPDNRIR